MKTIEPIQFQRNTSHFKEHFALSRLWRMQAVIVNEGSCGNLCAEIATSQQQVGSLNSDSFTRMQFFEARTQFQQFNSRGVLRDDHAQFWPACGTHGYFQSEIAADTVCRIERATNQRQVCDGNCRLLRGFS